MPEVSLFSPQWRATEQKQHSDINKDTGFPNSITPEESDAALADRVQSLEVTAESTTQLLTATKQTADEADGRSSLIASALLEGGRLIGNFTGLTLNNFAVDTVKYFNLGAATVSMGQKTIYPKSAPAQNAAALYDTSRTQDNPPGVAGKFIENLVEDQTNFWRLRFNFTGKASTKAMNLTIHLHNPTEDWTVTDTRTLTIGKTAGSFTVLLMSISDDVSIVSPNGLIIGAELSSLDAAFELELVQVVRITSTPLIYGQVTE